MIPLVLWSDIAGYVATACLAVIVAYYWKAGA